MGRVNMNRRYFFERIRHALYDGRLTNAQVEGLMRLLDYRAAKYPLDSRTKCNAVQLIRKYLERCFVSKAFAWSSIEEPFDLCKLGIRHG